MKRYSWILALILALSVGFIGCPAADDDDSGSGGGGGGGGDELPSLAGDGFTVTFVDKLKAETTQDVVVIENPGATLGYLDDNSGYLYTYGTGADMNYGNAIAYFAVDLGSKTLGDYEKVTFKWRAYGGDVTSYKRLFLLATGTESEIEPYKGDSAIMGICANASGGFNDEGSSAPQMNGTDEQEVTMNIKFRTALTGEVYFAFYVHAISGTYVIKDLKFVEWDSDPIAVTKVDYSASPTWFTGVPLTLTGDVTPENARKQEIVWTIKTGGTATATITENALTATTAGTISLTATIVDGLLDDGDYTEDFDDVITIVELGTESLASVAITGVDGVTDTTVNVPAGGGGLVAVTGGFTVNITQGYGNSAAYFKVDLGDKNLGDFSKVTITWKGNFGDINYKSVLLLAAEDDTGVTLPLADDDAIIAAAVNLPEGKGFYDGISQVNNGTDEVTVSLNIEKG